MNLQWGASAYTACEHCGKTIANTHYARHVDNCPYRIDLQESIKSALTASNGMMKTFEEYNASRGNLPSAHILRQRFGDWSDVALHFGLRSSWNATHRRKIIAVDGLRTREEVASRFNVSLETARTDLIAVYGKRQRSSNNVKGRQYGRRDYVVSVKVNFRISLSDLDQLQKLAEEKGSTKTNIVRLAIHEWLEMQLTNHAEQEHTN